MRTEDFDYDLPEELIALRPAPRREEARLLYLPENGEPEHRLVADLAALFGPEDILVLNDTKVFPAALKAVRPARPTGGGGDVTLDVNLLRMLDETEYETVWRAFVRPAKRLVIGDTLTVFGDLPVRVMSKNGPEADLAFEGSYDEVMARIDAEGAMPLPPYIARRRAADEADRHRYQTVFAERMGSVAAPTAGLHLTQNLLGAIGDRGAKVVRVTLHVGAGTFLPVTAEDTEDHVMHAEWGAVSEEAAEALNGAMAAGHRVSAVGTTALRILEAAAIGPRRIAPFADETTLFITPGYDFRIVDRLMTNFHLPRSTLLMLVAAFAGRARTMDAYRRAIAAGYRFYSYGDASLIERSDD